MSTVECSGCYPSSQFKPRGLGVTKKGESMSKLRISACLLSLLGAVVLAGCGGSDPGTADAGVKLTFTVSGFPVHSEDAPSIVQLTGKKGDDINNPDEAMVNRSQIVQEGGKVEFSALEPGIYYVYYLGGGSPPADSDMKAVLEIGYKVKVEGEHGSTQDLGAIDLKKIGDPADA